MQMRAVSNSWLMQLWDAIKQPSSSSVSLKPIYANEGADGSARLTHPTTPPPTSPVGTLESESDHENWPNRLQQEGEGGGWVGGGVRRRYANLCK